MYVYKSCYTAEINTIFKINYTSVNKVRFFEKPWIIN